MNLRLVRRWYTSTSAIGEMYVDGVWECMTLEDTVRHGDIFQVKVPGKTAIPTGRYRVLITFSQRFQMNLPLLVDVPAFDGIRIHAGNTAADTEGCILVGRTRESDAIGSSRAALATLLPKISEGLRTGEVWIDIENVGETTEEQA